jgi:DNA-binding response OmpR family regulator
MLDTRALIAVVDHDTTYIDTLCEILADQGYAVVCCRKGHEVQSMIRHEQPDVVILDIRRENPEAGWNALQLMRLVPATQDIPVIVCSADSQFLKANEQRLHKQGCEIVYKPFDLDELLAKITLVVGPPLLRKAEV